MHTREPINEHKKLNETLFNAITITKRNDN